MTAYLMEITETVPPSYERFTLRRLFHKELGMSYDNMAHGEVVEALNFMRLEQLHPHRFQPKKQDA